MHTRPAHPGAAPIARRAVLMLVTVSSVTLASPVLAQPGPPGRAGLDPAQREAMRKELGEKMRAHRLERMTEELRLTPTQIATLAPILQRSDEEAMAMGRAFVETLRALQAELEQPAPDHGKLTTLLSKLKDSHEQRHRWEKERFEALARALDPVQQARLALMLPRLEGAMRHRIHKALGGGKGRHGFGEGRRHP